LRYQCLVFIVMLFCLLCNALTAKQNPCLTNTSFEKYNSKDDLPGWRKALWGRDGLSPTIWSGVTRSDSPSGKRSAQVEITGAPHFAALAQEISTLTPGQWYEASVMLRTENIQGHGVFLAVEYWKNNGSDGSAGCINSECLIGNNLWTRATVKFLAPGKDYKCILSLWNAGGPGKAWFDDVRVVKITAPSFDESKRRVLDGPFWGMFTCYAEYLHKYGDDMKTAGVYWQRQGMGALGDSQKGLAERLGMAYQLCFDGMPAATNKDDICYPVTESNECLKYVQGCLNAATKTARVWEVYNEPNTDLRWNLKGYTETIKLMGREVKSRRPDDAFATGGLAAYQAGYVSGMLKNGADKILDMVLLHPYGVDEALDTLLYAVGDGCNKYNRSDMAVAINETGWPTYDPATGLESHSWFVSESEQSSNLVKLYVQGLAHRLSFVTWLGWNDLQVSDQARNMGLVRVDGTRKPAYNAFTFMTRTIGDRKIVKWSYADNGARIYQLGNDKPVWLVWNALSDSDVLVDVGSSKVFVCDIYGTKLTVLPASGKISLKAVYEPRYLVPVN